MLANPIPWPEGKKCCVSLTWDVDAESGLVYRHQERSTDLVSTRSFLRYGPTVAIPRLVELFARLELQLTFFFPGWVIDRYPASVDLLLENGHEIGLHGYMHERSNDLSPEKEAELLDRAIEAYVSRVGHRPRGWRAPGFTFSSRSADLLIEAGFEYDSSLMSDDVPRLLMGKNGGTLVEFSIDWTSDDWPHYMHNRDFDFMMPISSPARAMEVFRSEFDATWDYGSHWTTVWHPFLSARPARLNAIVELISYMRERGDVWFARLDQVCEHVRKLSASNTWEPTIEQLPYHQRPDID